MTGKYKKMNVKFFNSVGVITTVLVLSACNATSPTYGTGSSNQEQTIKGISNMLALTPEEAPDINYNTRPDLVMPANKAVLPQPVETRALSQHADWPESPEQRIAAAHAAAPEGDWRGSEDLPVGYLADTNKKGIGKETAYKRLRESSSKQKSGEAQMFNEMVDQISGKDKTREEVLQRRDQLTYSTGVKRKFLTEPPTEYRTPSANAEAGEIGISNKAIDEKLKKQKKDDFNTERGVIAPGG